MRMNQYSNNSIDNLLAEMRQHVSGLQEKLHVANSAVNKGQTINEKIVQIKEYQEKIASLNSCWRSKNRAQLVSNLQQENRQIIALEEENRQLRLALKEMEEGMHLIMTDYRKNMSAFMRSETLNELAEKQQKYTFLAGIDHEKYFEVVRAAGAYMAFSDLKAAEDETLIAQLRSENQVLRNLLHGSSLPLPIINTDQSCTDGASNSSRVRQNRHGNKCGCGFDS